MLTDLYYSYNVIWYLYMYEKKKNSWIEKINVSSKLWKSVIDNRTCVT